MIDKPRELGPDVRSTDDARLERRIKVRKGGALITVDVHTDHEDPLLVRVVDAFPEDAGVTKIRFLPEFEPMKGSLNTHGVVFEDVVRPDEPVTIKYGLSLDDPERVTEFSPPEIDLALPTDDVAGDVTLRGGGTAAALDAISADAPSQPVSVRGPPTASSAETEEPTVPPDAEPSDEVGARAPDSGSLLEKLIDELQRPSLPEERLDTLRDELLLDHPKSMEVRLRYIQSRLNEIDAFADTLEEFIDHHGSPAAVAEELHDEHERINEAIERLNQTSASADLDRSAMQARLRQIADELDELEAHHGDRIASAESGVAELRETHRAELATLEADVTANESRVEDVDLELEFLRSHLRTEIEALNAKLDDEAEGLRQRMSEEIATLAEDLDDTSDDLRSELETVSAKLEGELDALEGELSAAIEDARRSLQAEIDENTAIRLKFAEVIRNLRSLDPDVAEPEGAGSGDTPSGEIEFVQDAAPGDANDRSEG